MQHLAIDLGSQESQLCIRDEAGAIVLERRVKTRSLRHHLRKRQKSRVVLETCAEAFAVADLALEIGHEVRVVPATLVRALGVGARGIKTDVRDARVLSEASMRMELPSVHVPSASSREGKAMCNARDVLVKLRTMAINAQRGYLRTKVVKITRGSSRTFPDRVAAALLKDNGAKNSSEQEPTRPTPSGTTEINEVGHARGLPSQASSKQANDGHAAAAATTKEDKKYPSVLSEHGFLPVFADRLVCVAKQLTEWIEQADQELNERVAPDPVCQRLMSIPGVGPVCATRFVTTLDSVGRFAGIEQMQSYLGLVPGEHQSGEKQRRTGMIKCGAAPARVALVQSAWCLYRLRKKDPMVLWAMEIEKRRGKKVAIAALARKLATVMFVMWRDGTTYDPSRASRQNSKREEATATS